MKITLDLNDLVAKGQLSQAEADRLKGLAVQDTAALGVNILMAMGAVAVSAGICVLIPSLLTIIALGAAFFGLGLALTLTKEERWGVFAQIMIVVGALAFTGGVSAYAGGNLYVNIVLTLLVAVAAVLARSGLLAAVAVIALAATVGTLYSGWNLDGSTTVITMVVLSALAFVLYQASLRLPPVYENLAIIGARTAVFMVNVAFLFGSIFGDEPTGISAEVFAVVWTILLIVVGIWAMRAGRRWTVNIVAVFGAVHLLVQWFVHLGASPETILGAGVLLILFGFGLKLLNDRGLPRAAAE